MSVTVLQYVSADVFAVGYLHMVIIIIIRHSSIALQFLAPITFVHKLNDVVELSTSEVLGELSPQAMSSVYEYYQDSHKKADIEVVAIITFCVKLAIFGLAIGNSIASFHLPEEFNEAYTFILFVLADASLVLHMLQSPALLE